MAACQASKALRQEERQGVGEPLIQRIVEELHLMVQQPQREVVLLRDWKEEVLPLRLLKQQPLQPLQLVQPGVLQPWLEP